MRVRNAVWLEMGSKNNQWHGWHFLGPKLILISAQSFVNLRRTLQISVGSQWTSCLLLMLLLLGPYNFDVIRKIEENSGFEGGHLPFWSYPITSTMQCLVFVYCLENFWNVLGSPNMFQRRLHPLMALSQNCLSQSLSSENHFRQWNCATLGKIRDFLAKPLFVKAPNTQIKQIHHMEPCLESAFVVYLKSEAVDSMLVRHSHMYSYVIYALQYGQIIFKHASLVVSTVSTRLKSSFDSESMDWSKRNLTKPCPP